MNNSKTTYFFLTITIIFWGSGYVLSKIPINEVSPFIAVFTRFAIATFCCLIVLGKNWSTCNMLRLNEHILLITMGILLSFYNWFYLEGLKKTNVMDSIFVESAFIPILTIVTTYFMDMPVTKRQWIGVSIAILGCCCFFYPLLNLNQFSMDRFIGIGILFLSVIAWVGYTILAKKIFQKIDATVGTSYAIVISSLFLLIIAPKDLLHVIWSNLTPDYWLTQAYLAIFSSVIGNILYSISVEHVGPAKASFFLFLVPIVGFLLANLIVGETLSVSQLIGSTIMLFGVWHANRIGKSSLS